MVVDGAEEVIAGPHPLILVIENDIAKVLGNAINVLLKRQKKFICIDGSLQMMVTTSTSENR